MEPWTQIDRSGRLNQADLIRIHTIDMHTAGEPLRIFLPGLAAPRGHSILDLRRDMRARFDHWRERLMFEPRGHADMYGALILPATRPDADLSVLFLHNEGYSTMCGHAVIALGKAAVELGWVEAVEPVTRVAIEAPAGLVLAHVSVVAGRAVSTRFENVASFAPGLDRVADVPGVGSVPYDLGFGGAYYAYVDAASVGLDLRADKATEIVRLGRAIKAAVAAGPPIEHPGAADLGYLYGVIFTGPATSPGAHSRHACVFADGALDRSPTGTGVAGRVAILAARGALEPNQTLNFESLTGDAFAGGFAERAKAGPYEAVVPFVDGRAFFTGRHEFLLEADDPLPAFLFR